MSDLDERRLEEYLAAIEKKLNAAGEQGRSCLSDAEETTVVAYRFALEITNGGFEQFFVNPSGDRWRETLQAIKTVGAARLALLFEEALSVFPDTRPSDDQLTRCQQLEAAGPPARDLLWNLTGQYYDIQALSAEHCLYQRLTAFAIKQLANKRMT